MTKKEEILTLLQDNNWHSGPEIREAIGGADVMRRLRELRRDAPVERRYKKGFGQTRIWEYRIPFFLSVAQSGQSSRPGSGMS